MIDGLGTKAALREFRGNDRFVIEGLLGEGGMVYLVTALADEGALTGKLGGIRTIHFARWVALPDGRLLFFSNYDGSWEAYLGEFVDKASMGLTMIWSNTIWYPQTRLLILEGAKKIGRASCRERV